MSYPRPADRRLIPMEFDAARTTARLELGPGHARYDGSMYGGTGIAAAVIAMEAATERPALWTTVQFVGSPASGSVIECAIDTLARGHRITQVQVTGRADGEVAFVAIGSTAVRREDGLTGKFFTMPDVPPPDALPERHPLFILGERPAAHEHHHTSRTELRAVDDDHGGNGNVLLWTRLIDEPTLTPAGIAFLADMVPIAITRAAGKLGAGFSLDNSMRFGPEVDTEWILLELIGDLADGGFGHGSLRAWATDGTLVATGGQTANMRFVVDSAEEFAAIMMNPPQ